jgi:hypothetical protein
MNQEQIERELSKYHKPTPATDRPLYLRMLLYGTWGVGKTILSCQVGERPLLLITEPSDDSIADHPEIASRITVTEYGGVNHLKWIAEAFKSGYYTHDTLIVDTASELIEEQLDRIRDGYTPPKANTRPSFAGKGNLPTLEVVGTDDYRLLRDILRPTIKDLCLLPINLIFTAHERSITWADQDKNRRDGTPLPPVRPDLPSQTLAMIAKRVSVVGRMTRQGEKRQLSFRTDSTKEEVKSRIRLLDNRRISDTEFLEIVTKWRMTHG